jgi:hypothetical protein
VQQTFHQPRLGEIDNSRPRRVAATAEEFDMGVCGAYLKDKTVGNMYSCVIARKSSSK